MSDPGRARLCVCRSSSSVNVCLVSEPSYETFNLIYTHVKGDLHSQ